MKKFFVFISTLALVLSMSVTAFAVTPPLQAPDMPEIPDISDDVKVDIPDEYWDQYFDEHPIIPEQTVPPTEEPAEPPAEEPTEPPAEDDNVTLDWCCLISRWHQWLAGKLWRP